MTASMASVWRLCHPDSHAWLSMLWSVVTSAFCAPHSACSLRSKQRLQFCSCRWQPECMNRHCFCV